MREIDPISTGALPPGRKILLDIKPKAHPADSLHYINHEFDVPTNVERIGVQLTYVREAGVQLSVSLFENGTFRGTRMIPQPSGEIILHLWVAQDDSSYGGVAGPISPGRWRAQIDVRHLEKAIEYHLIAYADTSSEEAASHSTGSGPQSGSWSYPERTVKREAGWYKGELHAHTYESDGECTVEEMVEAAVAAELDFLSLTEHNTISQWRKMARLQDHPIALIRSLEITSHHGHANLQGAKEWVDVFVDRDDWSMNDAADALHAQGGLFCVNHAFAGDVGWRAFEFDWDKADLIEVFHNLEGTNNNLLPPLWDHHLRLGRRLIGVGGTDSHHPTRGIYRLGQVVTWVFAEELSERGILEGLRAGRVYVSRGPEMRFRAEYEGGSPKVEMGGSLPLLDRPIRFHISVKTDEELRLFILKNGYPFDTPVVVQPPEDQGSWQEITFRDRPKESAYYRFELHSVHQGETHPRSRWRDFTTMKVISNPIWVRNET